MARTRLVPRNLRPPLYPEKVSYRVPARQPTSYGVVRQVSAHTYTQTLVRITNKACQLLKPRKSDQYNIQVNCAPWIRFVSDLLSSVGALNHSSRLQVAS